MKIFFFLIIFSIVFLPIVSATEKINGLDVDWGGGTDYTLSYKNPSVSKGGYVIKIIDYNWKGEAVVSVTWQGETQQGILREKENSDFNFAKNITYYQGVRIYPKEISNFLPLPTNIGTYPCCPAAEITVYTSITTIINKPELKIFIFPNWDGRAGSTSRMDIQVNNSGDASFSEGNVTINITGLKIADPSELSKYALTYNPSKEIVTRGWSTPLLANSSNNITLSLKPPLPSNRSTYTISVQSYFKDYSGKIYQATASTTVSLNPTLEISKRITPSTIFGERRYDAPEVDVGYSQKFFGLGKTTVVNIRVNNGQSYPVKSVNLTDTIIPGFRLLNDSITPKKDLILSDNNTKLQWVFDINASEIIEFRYEMVAQKTGTFTAPSAVLNWREWGESKTPISSYRPSTTVYGIFVVGSKITDNTSLRINDTLNVITTFENLGDFPVGVNITDILPKNTTFISGTTSFSGFLYPMQITSLTYNLSVDNIGKLELPSPEITFWKKEFEGQYAIIPANNIIVTAVPPVIKPGDVTNISQNITSTSTPLPKSLLDIIGEKAPWLEGAIPIIMLFVAIILMLLLHVINR